MSWGPVLSAPNTVTATASSVTPRTDSIVAHGNGIITQATRVAASEGQYGSLPPNPMTICAYSAKATPATTTATTASAAGDSHQMSATAPAASARPLTRRVI